MLAKVANTYDSGNMKAENKSSSLSVTNISRTNQFGTSEELLSHLLTNVDYRGKCTVFLDYDDTIAFKFHPDGTSEQDLMRELADPNCDFDDCLRKVGDCRHEITQSMIDILNQIQSFPDKYQLVIVTRRESGTDIQELFDKVGLKEPTVLHQITLYGNESGSSIRIGGKLFEVEPNRSLTIDKGAIIGEWISKNRQSVQNAVYIDDIDLNVNAVKEFLNAHENEIHKCTHYGTLKDGSWIVDTK
tara:strand:+ start:3095 stop:3829 length:735 start_codon:yes stop_codon:yes gene_type:complete